MKGVEQATEALRRGGSNSLGSTLESVVSNVVEQQIQVYEATMKHSPVAALLRQQAVLTDMMLAVLKAQKEWALMRPT